MKKMSSNFPRVSLMVLATTLALSACGGGGSDGTASAAAGAVASSNESIPATQALSKSSASSTTDARAQALVDEMSLEEKSALLYGYGTKPVNGQIWQVHVKDHSGRSIHALVQGEPPKATPE